MNEEKQRSAFEVITQLILPLISILLVALPIAQRHLLVALGLLFVAVFSLSISQIPAVFKWLRGRKLQERQRSICIEALDELTGRIHTFYDFVSASRSDALYNFVFTKLCQASQSDIDALIPIPWQLFAETLGHLTGRIDREKNVDSLRQYVLEFSSIVRSYSAFVVCPFYRRVPGQLSGQLLARYHNYRVESDLIQFRERFDRFLEAYTDLLRDLDRRLPVPLNVEPYFERPHPVMSVQMSDTINSV